MMAEQPGHDRAFVASLLLLFFASSAGTVACRRSMSTMGGMPMPGGWTMSMTWMLAPGRTWPEAAAAFGAMWLLMMVPMMLPSLGPVLRRYRQSQAVAGGKQLGAVT